MGISGSTVPVQERVLFGVVIERQFKDPSRVKHHRPQYYRQPDFTSGPSDWNTYFTEPGRKDQASILALGRGLQLLDYFQSTTDMHIRFANSTECFETVFTLTKLYTLKETL
jgi:hypothetical protein